MPISFRCPKCGENFTEIRKEFIGKRIQCHCGQILLLGPRDDKGGQNSAGSFDRGSSGDLDDLIDDSDSETIILTDKHLAPGASESDSDIWNTRQLKFKEIEPKKRKSKSKSSRYDSDAHPPPAEEPQFSIFDEPSVMRATENTHQALPPPPPIQYRSPNFGRLAYAPAGSSKPAITVVISCLALLQCFLLSVLGMAINVRYGSTLQEFTANDTSTSLFAPMAFRLLIGIVLLVSSISFGCFLIASIMSSSDEMAEPGFPRPAPPVRAGIAGGVFFLVLVVIGILMGTVAGGQNTVSGEKIVSEYWPEGKAEIFGTIAALSLIPIFIFVVGIVRAFDQGGRAYRSRQ